MTDETELGMRAVETAQQARADERKIGKARQDRLINVMLFGVAVVTVVTLIVALLSWPIITSGSDAANATKDAGELTACRASYNVIVIDATSRLDDASRAVDLLTNESLQAIFQKDQATIDRDLPLIPPARDLVRLRTTERDDAVRLYKDAVRKSGVNPDVFLNECRTHPPI